MPDVIDLSLRRAEIAPKSINDKERTVEVIWTTGADVARRDYDGAFIERLSLDPKHVDLSRLNGAQVLNTHQQSDLGKVLGVVLDATVDGKEGRATLKISSRPDVEPFWQDIKAGVLRYLSVGYVVNEWDETTDPKTGERVRIAVSWTPHEISLVPVPADPGAVVRAKEVIMPDGNSGAALENRAQDNQEIRSIARIAGLGSEFADKLIDDNASPEQARKAAFEELAKRGGGEIRTQTVDVIASNDDPETRAARMGEALYTRIDPGHKPGEAAREFVGMSIPDLARDCLRHRGVSIVGLSGDSLVTRALHGTSDFPLILGDTVGRTIRKAYEAAPMGIKALASQTTAKDFRAKTRIMLGEAPTLEKVNEHGEFKSGTMAEAAESYNVDTFGKIIGISRQALINDDLGAFTDLSRRLGQAAAEFEAQFLVDLLESGSGNGPSMSDGKALFHADHGNKAGSGAAIAEATLSAARLAMRKQTGLSGKPIGVTPKFILVPPELETTVEKELAAITAAATSDVNVFANGLTVVVEPRLSNATRWYVIADPAQIDGLEYAYLEGSPGPQIETKQGFEVDGVQLKVRLDFGAGFIDWRPWYMNAGA